MSGRPERYTKNREKRMLARRRRHALQAWCPVCSAMPGSPCPKPENGFHEERAAKAFEQRQAV